MSILDIVQYQKEKGKDFESLKPLVIDYFNTVKTSLGLILLAFVSDAESEITLWAKKHNITSGDIAIKRLDSSYNDFAYYGFWHVEAKYLNNTDEEINEELQTIFDSLSNYDYRMETNESHKGKTGYFLVPVNNLSLLYDYFIPEKFLKEYRASQLEVSLSSKSDKNSADSSKI